MVIKRLTGSGKDWLSFSPPPALHPSRFVSYLLSPFPHRSPQLLVPIHWCRSLYCHLYGQRSLKKGEEEWDRGGRERQRDVWCVYMGEKLISWSCISPWAKSRCGGGQKRRPWMLTPWRKPRPKSFHILRPLLSTSAEWASNVKYLTSACTATSIDSHPTSH